MKESDMKRLETAIRNLKTVEKSLMKVWLNTSNSKESIPCMNNPGLKSWVSMYVGEMVVKVETAREYIADKTEYFIKQLKIE